jgi:hypothetical protein
MDRTPDRAICSERFLTDLALAELAPAKLLQRAYPFPPTQMRMNRQASGEAHGSCAIAKRFQE